MKRHLKKKSKPHYSYLIGLAVVVAFALIFIGNKTTVINIDYAATTTPQEVKDSITKLQPLDKELYDKKMFAIANNASTTSTTTPFLWPVKGPYPSNGALLPFNRIIAYYGNFYSKQMGILGEYPADEMLRRLRAEVARWQAADPTTPTIPGIHYIAVTAQASAGQDGKYRLRMPHKEIDKALDLAQRVNGVAFIDIQVGLSDVRIETPLLEKYLKMPQVHFGVDPEFYMRNGVKPGKVIGTISAADINWVTEYLAKLVRENNLPPKILVIHRFTRPMITNYKQIILRPEVQIVIDMDGWGHQARKMNTYREFIYKEPVQFTGFKLFYKNDLKEKDSRLMTPAEVLKLKPKPMYIQYQ
jgi:hypothetical protein